jgi:hypothetical protein
VRDRVGIRWSHPSRALASVAIGTLLLLGTGCGFGSGSFNLSNASVDPRYVCPRGSNNTPYDIHASANAHNGTSVSVTVKTVTAVLTVASVHGSWLQQVGSRYEAGQVSFQPTGVGAGSDATLHVTIPSACTNNSGPSAAASYADYTVTLTVVSSAGTNRIETQNRHRITAA